MVVQVEEKRHLIVKDVFFLFVDEYIIRLNKIFNVISYVTRKQCHKCNDYIHR